MFRFDRRRRCFQLVLLLGLSRTTIGLGTQSMIRVDALRAAGVLIFVHIPPFGPQEIGRSGVKN
jgi:hypothetical protein